MNSFQKIKSELSKIKYQPRETAASAQAVQADVYDNALDLFNRIITSKTNVGAKKPQTNLEKMLSSGRNASAETRARNRINYALSQTKNPENIEFLQAMLTLPSGRILQFIHDFIARSPNLIQTLREDNVDLPTYIRNWNENYVPHLVEEDEEDAQNRDKDLYGDEMFEYEDDDGIFFNRQHAPVSGKTMRKISHPYADLDVWKLRRIAPKYNIPKNLPRSSILDRLESQYSGQEKIKQKLPRRFIQPYIPFPERKSYVDEDYGRRTYYRPSSAHPSRLTKQEISYGNDVDMGQNFQYKELTKAEQKQYDDAELASIWESVDRERKVFPQMKSQKNYVQEKPITLPRKEIIPEEKTYRSIIADLPDINLRSYSQKPPLKDTKKFIDLYKNYGGENIGQKVYPPKTNNQELEELLESFGKKTNIEREISYSPVVVDENLVDEIYEDDEEL